MPVECQPMVQLVILHPGPLHVYAPNILVHVVINQLSAFEIHIENDDSKKHIVVDVN